MRLKTVKPAGVRLALELIKEFHGDLAEQVMAVLLRKGRSTLTDLVLLMTDVLTRPQICRALLVLMQHNLLDSHLQIDPSSRGGVRQYYLYVPRVDVVLSILRYPRMLVCARDRHGEVAEALILALMEGGRLRSEQAVYRAGAKLGRDIPEGFKGPSEDHPFRDIRGALASLIKDRLVERVPPASLPPSKVDPHDNVKSRRSTKSPFEHDTSARQAETADYQRQRYEVPQDLVLGLDDGPAGAAAGPAVKKRKTAAVDSDVRNSATDIQWRISVRGFDLVFRHEECVETVRERNGKEAALVIESILDIHAEHETGDDWEQRSVPLSERQIYGHTTKVLADRAARRRVQQELTGGAEGEEGDGDGAGPSGAAAAAGAADEDPDADLANLEQDRCSAMLRDLQSDNDIVTGVTELQDGYWTFTANMERIMDLRQLSLVQCIVQRRYGLEGNRIMQCILYRGILEQKQIADVCMIPLKEARELLYKMMRGGFVRMFDVSKTTDHAPSRSFFLWDVELERVKGEVYQQLQQSALNVLLRYRHEMAQGSEILALVAEVTRAQREGRQAPISLSGAQIQEIQVLQQRVNVLTGALLSLDGNIAVFTDFA